VTRFRIVPERSQVWFDARSNVHPIHSSTDGLEGYVEIEMGPGGDVDLAFKPVGRLSLPVGRLSSGNRMQDRELFRRIDATQHPRIEGVLDKMQRFGTDQSYEVSGDVTFRGVSRRLEDVMTIVALDPDTIKLTGTSRFDIRDFGMEPPRVLILKVDPEVDVRVEIIAVREA